MHVLWTPSWYPTPEQPFNGSFFAEQVEILRDSGLTVGVIAVKPTTAWKHRPGSFSLDRENQVIHQDMPTVPLGIVPGDSALIAHYANHLGDVYEREFGIPDVIHAHSVFPGLLVAQALAKRWGVPYGLTEHRPSSLTRNPKSFRYQLIRDAVCAASFHYAVSPDFASKLSHYYGCSTFGAMSLPVPGRFFEQPLHTHKEGTPYTFVHVSHLDRNKRVEESIEAFDAVHREFPNTHLLIIGGDPERVSELRSLTSMLRCRDAVEFVGRVGRMRMPKEMNRGDCLILFSAREAGGTVFAEAQSLGIPCVASATPGGLHMASDGMGQVVPIDDTCAMADAMADMVRAAEAGEAKSPAEIRKRAWGRSSASVFVQRHIRAYRKVVDRHQSREDVLFVTRIHLPEASAASLRINAVEKAVEAIGSRVRVITSQPPSSLSVGRESDVTRVPVLRDSEDYLRGYLPYMSFDLQAFWHVLRGKKPSVAVVEPPPTTGAMMRVASAIKRFPYVWYAADVWSDASESTGAPSVVVRTVKMMESFAVSGAAGVVAVSDGVAERVRELGGSNVLVQPNGADTELFNPDGRQLTDGQLAAAGVTHPYFIYAGTASEWQGAEIFVDAFATVLEQHPDTQIVFLSRGSQVPSIAERAKALAAQTGMKDPVLILDPVSPEEAAAWQRGAIGALVSIVPGLGYDFAYPTKVLTALACGTPVVYAGAGPATVDIAENRLGEVAEFSADDVASAMSEVRRKTATAADRKRLAAWVQDNKSMSAMGEAVASFVLSCARSERS